MELIEKKYEFKFRYLNTRCSKRGVSVPQGFRVFRLQKERTLG